MDVNAYFSGLDPARKKELLPIRELINKTLPQVKETLSYGIPTYELSGTPILALGFQKNYMSIYACGNPDLLNKYSKELSNLNCGKSCIRFEKYADLPIDVIENIFKESIEF